MSALLAQHNAGAGAATRNFIDWYALSHHRKTCETTVEVQSHEQQIGNRLMNDNDQKPVTIIVGRVWRRKGGESEGVHLMLVAPDDDSAVRMALDALAKEGYAEAELDQIGDMQEIPDEEPHLSAYQGALEGEVSIVTFNEAR